MTFRLRSRTRARRSLFETEERRDTLVIVGFVALIILLIFAVVAAIGLNYYDQNIRPLANVGSTQVSPDMLRNRVAVDQARLTRDEGRLRVLQQNNEIDAAQLSSALDDLNTKGQGLTPDSVTEELIDLIYQDQLAASEGVAPTASEIDAAVDKEFTTPEQRHVFEIAVKPESTGDNGPTVVQRQAAIDKANQALAELQAGADFATVAQKYSSATNAANGGDAGFMSQNNPIDPAWTKALFALQQNGTTPVTASLGCSRSDAGDCLYRIGRVTEIRPGAVDQTYKDKVLAKMSPDSLRQIVGWETSASKLREKITAASTTGDVDQVHLAEIIIRNTEADPEETDPTADQGEIHFSQILFAPNDNPDTAADLPETDPAWAKARTDADAAFAELQALTDPTARADKFADLAKAQSDDDATKAGGGNVDFTGRSLLPTEVAKALFDTQHNKGDLIGPIKDETGYYVMLFDERRGTPQQRLEALKADIAAGVAWDTLVTKYSDGTDVDKANGADIGWFTRDMLKSIEGETVDKIFALQANQISDPIVFSSDSYIFRAIDHAMRPLDPNQVAQLTDPDFGAFANWYSDKKNEAETARTITRAGQELPTDTSEPS
jgi:parvulin-like peptidyl-prolyl isomerase